MLWFRPTRRHKWQAVATGPTATDVNVQIGIGGRHNGEWLTLPAGTLPGPVKAAS